MTSLMNPIAYQIHIELADISPKIWRRITLNPDVFLDDFHRIIQTTMGWTNSHLHQFLDEHFMYAPAEFEVENTVDSRKVKLIDILNQDNPQIKYEYDFGDGWEYIILLEKIEFLNKPYGKPVCIDGALHCPHEDCGGVHGYLQMLEVLKKPRSMEYKEYIEWLGGPFHPEHFDKDKVNEFLKCKDYGCPWYTY
jgi:hypothetical protein